jgi:hypothetical protein
MSQQPYQTLIKSVSEAHGTNYETWAEIVPCTIPQDTVCLRFFSTWSGARDSTARQVKSEHFLDAHGRRQLISLLSGNLTQ